MNEAGDVSERIGALHEAVIEVAVDGFGAGYSSLDELKKFAVDTIKIYHSLVPEISGEASSQTVSQAINAMAHTARSQGDCRRGRNAGATR